MRKIAILDHFLNEQHRAMISEAAAKCGFAADFYPDGPLPEEKLPEYEVIYGLPVATQLKAMTALRWLCSSFAGVDTYNKDELYSQPIFLSNSSGAYGTTISEHIIMVTLMLLRRMPEFQEITARHGWQQEIPMGSIAGSRITVLGTGDIGTTFARKAKAMDAAYICGVRRSPKPADSCFDKVLTFDRMDEILPQTDILVMALPGTAETRNIIDARRIALLPKTAILINVGRGFSLDQVALADALNHDRLAGAALDVMVPEPLPENDPLWNAKNIIITPHCAGNFSLQITRDRDVALFCEDLENYAAGRPLARLVDRRLGY